MNDLIDKLKNYVQKFNSMDEECYFNDIKNADAFSWMKENIPLIDCPDKELEEMYYFRWWVYRKHIKSTPEGYIITEFLPKVPWAKEHNSINAAVGHHLAEGRWIKNSKNYLEDYIRFWLNRREKGYIYSMWLVSAVWDYCELHNEYSIGTDNLDAFCQYFSYWEKEHLEPCGLFWSIDNNDAMEYSISGYSGSLRGEKGFRPTLNSYMAADAFAIAKFATIAGENEIASKYIEKGNKIRSLIMEKLWDGDFFKSHYTLDENGNLSFGKMPEDRDVRELVGYIPWYFNLPQNGMEKAFSYLKTKEGFLNDFGMTTAEQSHSKFLYEVDHECLWNGYIWPFATSQTLRAMGNLLHYYNQDTITKNDFYEMLRKYVKSQHIVDSNGKTRPWIDEVIDPRDGQWSSRNYLQERGWIKGGYERGKDYNHSTFCDIILNDLLGVKVKNGKLSVNPVVPDTWKYFKVENLYVNQKKYRLTYNNGALEISEE